MDHYPNWSDLDALERISVDLTKLTVRKYGPIAIFVRYFGHGRYGAIAQREKHVYSFSLVC